MDKKNLYWRDSCRLDSEERVVFPPVQCWRRILLYGRVLSFIQMFFNTSVSEACDLSVNIKPLKKSGRLIVLVSFLMSFTLQPSLNYQYTDTRKYLNDKTATIVQAVAFCCSFLPFKKALYINRLNNGCRNSRCKWCVCWHTPVSKQHLEFLLSLSENSFSQSLSWAFSGN